MYKIVNGHKESMDEQEKEEFKEAIEAFNLKNTSKPS